MWAVILAIILWTPGIIIGYFIGKAVERRRIESTLRMQADIRRDYEQRFVFTCENDSEKKRS